jgi:hypothetical protein
MNESEGPLNDEMLGELLAPLRDVSIPDNVQTANRYAIARALERNIRPVWWRRSVAVPMPVAIAATVAIVAASVALLVPAVAQKSVGHQVTQTSEARVVAIESDGGLQPAEASPGSWRITRSYIQSLSSLGTTRVVVDFDTKENRDDS